MSSNIIKIMHDRNSFEISKDTLFLFDNWKNYPGDSVNIPEDINRDLVSSFFNRIAAKKYKDNIRLFYKDLKINNKNFLDLIKLSLFLNDIELGRRLFVYMRVYVCKKRHNYVMSSALLQEYFRCDYFYIEQDLIRHLKDECSDPVSKAEEDFMRAFDPVESIDDIVEPYEEKDNAELKQSSLHIPIKKPKLSLEKTETISESPDESITKSDLLQIVFEQITLVNMKYDNLNTIHANPEIINLINKKGDILYPNNSNSITEFEYDLNNKSTFSKVMECYRLCRDNKFTDKLLENPSLDNKLLYRSCLKISLYISYIMMHAILKKNKDISSNLEEIANDNLGDLFGNFFT
jgi:hypothetical protein